MIIFRNIIMEYYFSAFQYAPMRNVYWLPQFLLQYKCKVNNIVQSYTHSTGVMVWARIDIYEYTLLV